MSLLQFMGSQRIVPPLEDNIMRKNAINTLKQIVYSWIKKVAWQRRLPRQQIAATSATILTYGSYGLGAHGSESDIDALCVGPFFATMTEDFFIVLYNMLKSRPEVAEIHCVKDAKVPLMRFKFYGISVDLPYARLNILSVPDNVDVLNPLLMRDIDETSRKSLSGARANTQILQIVPNLEVFQDLLRCVKLWAKRRGVYGSLNGFLGGIHLAVLSAYVCLQFANDDSLSSLLSKFFMTFAFWKWPEPVFLQDGMIPSPKDDMEFESMDMPILLPCYPYEYCHSNITRSTFTKIRTELLRAHNMTMGFLQSGFKWAIIFEPYPYMKRYARFIKIYLSASDEDDLGDWVGWVKSRFPALLVKMEESGLFDPNPTEYSDEGCTEPNIVFYWGLQPGRNRFIDIESIQEDFKKDVCSYGGGFGTVELSIVQACNMPKNGMGSGRTATRACWKMRHNQAKKQMYSQHLPNYCIGYMAIIDKDNVETAY